MHLLDPIGLGWGARGCVRSTAECAALAQGRAIASMTDSVAMTVTALRAKRWNHLGQSPWVCRSPRRFVISVDPSWSP
jgi:hypothetical protein